jgi:two-component system nitrate/nitrite response regulator NarL
VPLSQSSVPPQAEPKVTTVAIIDDHPIARRGLEVIFGSSPSMIITESVTTADELTNFGSFDLVILNLYLKDACPHINVISDLQVSTRVLVVSEPRHRDDVLAAIRAGARGYLTSHAGPQLILSAAATVAAGGFALSPQLADLLRADLPTSSTAPATTSAVAAFDSVLSAREDEALLWIARGYTHQQAAVRMGISKATVDTYVGRIRAKLQLGNKAELTCLAIERHGRLR